MKKPEENTIIKKANKCEVFLLLFTILLLLTVVSLFIVLVYDYDTGTCTTHECIRASAQISNFIDGSVDPCDDFHKFVCGKFTKKSLQIHEVPIFNEFETLTSNQLDALITEPTTETLPKPFQLQRKFYKSCMNTTAIENNSTKILLNLIKQMAGWPVMDGTLWEERDFDWLNSTVQSRQLGLPYEYFLQVMAIQEGSVFVSIRPPVRKNLTEDSRKSYIGLMANIALDLGVKSYYHAKNQFNKVLELDDIINIFIQDEEKYGQELTLEIWKLQIKFPKFPWIEFLSKITKSTFNRNTLIRFKANRYLENLQNLLIITPKMTQVNYIVWKTVESLHNYLKKSVREKYHSWVTSNPISIYDHKSFCVDQAKFYFPLVAETVYMREYVTSEKRFVVKEMIRNIKNQLKEKIKNNDWIDAKTKDFIENKLSEIKIYVGATDEIFDENFDLFTEMEKFTLPSENIMEMVTKLNIKKNDDYFKDVNKNYDELKETSKPIIAINTLQKQNSTSFVLPASLLQHLIYNNDRPLYMNYGALGSVIGYELALNILPQEIDFEHIYWPSESQKILKNKIRDILQIEDNLDDFKNSDKLAINKILARSIGSSASYEAYQNWVSINGHERKLLGMDYSQNQIFWIMSGIPQCFLLNKEVSPVAIGITVRNSLDFASDFNCTIGSRMNPAKKCQIL